MPLNNDVRHYYANTLALEVRLLSDLGAYIFLNNYSYLIFKNSRDVCCPFSKVIE